MRLIPLPNFMVIPYCATSSPKPAAHKSFLSLSILSSDIGASGRRGLPTSRPTTRRNALVAAGPLKPANPRTIKVTDLNIVSTIC